uniref:Uncharacterized protein n=1 Tax=Arion vulgaris TaxID=1028688 RepID=A0A0B7AGQ7_9EUPU
MNTKSNVHNLSPHIMLSVPNQDVDSKRQKKNSQDIKCQHRMLGVSRKRPI